MRIASTNEYDKIKKPQLYIIKHLILDPLINRYTITPEITITTTITTTDSTKSKELDYNVQHATAYQ